MKTYTFMGLDGYAGFRWRQQYTFAAIEQDGEVAVPLDHAPGCGPLRLPVAQFREWFKK